MREQILQRFNHNVTRVRNLVTLYQAQGGVGQGRRPLHSADILRAAVVLLHASLEEVFRAIFVWKMPHADEATLNDVPLVGTSTPRAEKFFLGRLAAHRGKRVDEVLLESVNAVANMMSLNSTDDVAHMLLKFGLTVNEFDPFMAPLSDMFSRRHHIVHQADRNENQGVGHQRAKSLSVERVNMWISTTERFATKVLQEVPGELL